MSVLREALSKQDGPFVNFMSLDKTRVSDAPEPVSTQVNEVDLQKYRKHRQLNPAEQAQLVDAYSGGQSTYELARQFGIHRCTVAKHLERAGIEIPSQLKMTPDVLEQARRLYANGNSLAMIGGQLGVDATTVHKALRKVGVRMRDTHGRPT